MSPLPIPATYMGTVKGLSDQKVLSRNGRRNEMEQTFYEQKSLLL